MPVQPISAVDCVSPALARTGRQMFRPVRFGFWARMALVGLFTGEFATSGGGFNFNFPMNVPAKRTDHLLAFDWHALLHDPRIIALIAVAAAAAVVMLFVWMYIGSVYRFVLFESVLTGECKLGEGWRKWNPHGVRLFVWRIGFSLLNLFVLAIIVGVGFVTFKSLGLLHGKPSGAALAEIILLALLFGFVAVIITLAFLIVWLLTKDFVVGIMLFEAVDTMEGWRRLIPMLRADPWGYVFYVLMKVVLAFAAAIIFGILDVIVMLVLMIPVVIVGVVIAIAVPSSAWHWNPVTITLVIVFAAVAISVLTYLIAVIAAPSVVFFESYVLNFFGSRYQPLAHIMFPEPPAPPPAPEPPPAPPAPETPPDLSPAPA